MKKTKMLMILMVMAILVMSLAGCSDTPDVKEQLCGPWGYTVDSVDGTCYKFYIFSSDDTYQSVWENVNAPSKNSEGGGTYEIEKDKIILTEDDGSLDTVIEYSYKNGKLKLIDKNSDNSGNHEMMYVED